MWKWISLCVGRKTNKTVEELKREWLAKNNIRKCEAQCFFCEKAKQDSKRRDMGWYFPDCTTCPARKIDENFSCTGTYYSYQREPRLFYAELKRLNKIRLAKKK